MDSLEKEEKIDDMSTQLTNYREQAKLVRDLSVICGVSKSEAKLMLDKHKWDIQVAIDTFLEEQRVLEENEGGSLNKEDGKVKLINKGKIEENQVTGDTSAEASFKPKRLKPDEFTSNATTSEKYSKYAPEKFSILSWNLDGLDEKGLEKRTEAVIQLVQREQHDILFFQELIPVTFDFIARKLSDYTPIIGTDNSSSLYFTATFLKDRRVYYESELIIPFPGTSMDRKILLVKAFIGNAKLALVNAHLESTAEFAKERINQLQLCFEKCSSITEEYNVIFGGDLNLRDKEVAGLLPSNFCDLWINCGSRESCKYTWDLTRNNNKQMPSRFQPRCRFDRLYFRNSNPGTLTPEFFGVTGIEKVEQLQSFPSDHWAIIAFFRLSEDARKPNKKSQTQPSSK